MRRALLLLAGLLTPPVVVVGALVLWSQTPAPPPPAPQAPTPPPVASRDTEPPTTADPARDWEIREPQGQDYPLDSKGRSHAPACGEGWYLYSVSEGRRRALERGCPLLVIVERKDCKHCSTFNRRYLADPDFARLMKDPGWVVVKGFLDPFDAGELMTRRTPTFHGFDCSSGRAVPSEWIEGILEPPIMLKRLEDVLRGKGRLGELQRRLEEDPQDLEALQELVSTYLSRFPLPRQLELAEKVVEADPDWLRGRAVHINVLSVMSRNHEPGVATRLQRMRERARHLQESGKATLTDLFVLGYIALRLTQEYDLALQAFEAALALDPECCELWLHKAFAHANLAIHYREIGDRAATLSQLQAARDAYREARKVCDDPTVPDAGIEKVEELLRQLGVQHSRSPAGQVVPPAGQEDTEPPTREEGEEPEPVPPDKHPR